MKPTFPLGRIAGVRIGAHWSALVTVGLFAWILGSYLSGKGSAATVWITAVAGALALIACLLAHELAHSIVARRSGVHVQGIVLWLLGGVSELTDEPPDARTDLRVAIAGPATSLLLGVMAAGAALVADAVAPASALTAALVWLATVNVVLAVFNLLPGAPLDGGRVLRAVLWWRSGDRLRAETAAARSGQLLGLTLIVLGAAEIVLTRNLSGLWLMLLGWFLRTSAQNELVLSGLRHRLGESRIRDIMTAHPTALPADWTISRLLTSDAVHTGHRVFPVLDRYGHPFAVLAWADILRTPENRRETLPLTAVARTLPPTAIVTEDTLVADVVSRVVLRPNLDAVAVVDTAGRLTGLVTATDLALACNRSALGLPIQRSPRAIP